MGNNPIDFGAGSAADIKRNDSGSFTTKELHPQLTMSILSNYVVAGGLHEIFLCLRGIFCYETFAYLKIILSWFFFFFFFFSHKIILLETDLYW